MKDAENHWKLCMDVSLEMRNVIFCQLSGNFLYASKVMSLKKERDSLVQRMQHDSPSDTQRTRGLQRENAQVCL